MIFVIAGTAESDRNTVRRLLADNLGWEFVDAENLHPPADLGARNCNPSPTNADPSLQTETLSAAINSWIYEWRDVVVSCPMLTEKDRRQLSEKSSLVKIVCLAASRGTGRTPFLDRSVHVVSTECPDGWPATREPEEKEALTVDSSRQVEEIIAEIVSALVLKRGSPCNCVERTGL